MNFIKLSIKHSFFQIPLFVLKEYNDSQMQLVLASKGFTRAAHQTPLEFAFALNMPEAVRITEKYNRVRFGEKNLSKDEANEIENWLNDLAKNKE